PINLIADGRPPGAMEVVVRVLPFSLPRPKTYYDTRKDYLVTIYATGQMGSAETFKIPQAEVDRQQRAIYKNLLDHNVFNVRSDTTLANNRNRAAAIEMMRHELRLMKQAGVTMKPLLSRGWVFHAGGEG